MRGSRGDILNEMYLSVVLLNGLSAPAEIPIYVIPFCTAVSLITTFISRRQLLTEQKKKSSATEAREIYQETYMYSKPTRIMRLKIMITFVETKTGPVESSLCRQINLTATYFTVAMPLCSNIY